jgi:hypothetical protein
MGRWEVGRRLGAMAERGMYILLLKVLEVS